MKQFYTWAEIKNTFQRPVPPSPVIPYTARSIGEEYKRYFHRRSIPDLEIGNDERGLFAEFKYHGEQTRRHYKTLTECFKDLYRVTQLRERYWDYP